MDTCTASGSVYASHVFLLFRVSCLSKARPHFHRLMSVRIPHFVCVARGVLQSKSIESAQLQVPDPHPADAFWYPCTYYPDWHPPVTAVLDLVRQPSRFSALCHGNAERARAKDFTYVARAYAQLARELARAACADLI